MLDPQFVEIEFSMPFYEMYFPDTWNDNNLVRNPFELIELGQYLNIIIDTNLLYDYYTSTPINKGDIYIFYKSLEDKNLFIYFDLFKDSIDQMAMIRFGVRIKKSDYENVKKILNKLYFKSTTRTSIKEDYFNNYMYKISQDELPLEKRDIKKIITRK